jgi:hypothetical protein
VRNLIYNGHAVNNIVEMECHVLDCTRNDRTRYEQGFGLCHSSSIKIDKKGVCETYSADFIFIAYNQKYKSEYGDKTKTIEIIKEFMDGLNEIWRKGNEIKY